MNARALLFCLLFPFAAIAQGFAGLGSAADGFAVPAPAPVFDFPTDHALHPDFRIEWWYLTANITGPDGTDYGLQWTLFRSALAPEAANGWQSPQLWMGHAALTTPDQHFVTERLARGGIGQAGVSADPFAAWIDDWTLAGPGFDQLRMTASGPDFAYDVALTAEGPLVFHGADGYSVKSGDGQASYYYSQPRYALSGVITLPDGTVPVTGSAWLDREWSSQPLSDNQTGWDWFSLSFESGDKLMGFLLRQSDGTSFSSATWIGHDGTVAAYSDGAFAARPVEQSQVAGGDIPTTWQVTLPDRGVDVTVSAINRNAWMNVTIPYWEGPVRITGSHDGRGYLEMTGYE